MFKQGFTPKILKSALTLVMLEICSMRWLMHILVGFGFLALIAGTRISIASAQEIGGDEHFEVTKAFLWSQGPDVYTRVWNDQPPLFTVLLGVLFRSFGSDIGVARCLASIFGVALLVGLYLIVWRREGALPAYIVVLTLLAAPGVFELCVSVMLEVPAIALGLWSVPLLDLWISRRTWRWLMASGTLFACALQTKLTAAILMPALVFELMLARHPSSDAASSSWRGRLSVLALWLFSVIVVYLILGASLGAYYSTFWQSHFSGIARGSEEAQHFAFYWKSLLAQPEALFGVFLTTVAAWRTGDWHLMLFPWTLLATAGMVHTVHRPYWSYYALHFALPMAWISGHGMNVFIRICSDYWRGCHDRLVWQRWSVCIALSLGIAIYAELGLSRLLVGVNRIQTHSLVDSEPVLGAMQRFSAQTKWIYTTLPMYAFHARLSMIPELAVLPLKRFWCGEIDNATIAAKVQEYRPEQLLFSVNSRPIPELTCFLEKEYMLIYQDEIYCLWVARWIALEYGISVPPGGQFLRVGDSHRSGLEKD
jgi:4-amino-4-deoxy-L-arabinose transferase-like glycosyltransferase